MTNSTQSEEMMESIDPTKVGSLAKSGASWSLILTIAKNIISLGSTAILARILSPDDYGLIGMVATLTILMTTFQDMGLSLVTLQRKNLSRAQTDNLFWLNCAFGLILWPLCIPCGYLLEMFYGRSELRMLVPVMGFLFVIDGIGAQPRALINRSLNIKMLSTIEVVSQILGIAMAIIAALCGWKYWAIVAQSFVQQISRLVFVILISKYIPRWPKRGASTWSLLRLGGAITGYGFLSYFSRNADNLLIGRYWGATELGFYSRAYFLMTLPSALITASFGSVMVPTLSAFLGDPDKLGKLYRKTFQAIALFAWPLALGMTLTSFDLVRFVYGEKWLPVVPILFWLSLASVSQTLYNTTGWLFISSGNSKVMLKWAAINAVVLIAGFFYGIHWKGAGVAQAYFFLTTFILTIPALYLAHKTVRIHLIDSLKTLLPVLKSSLLMIAVVIAAEYFLNRGDFHWKAKLFIKIGCGVISYSVSTLYFVEHIPFNFLNRWRSNLKSYLK